MTGSASHYSFVTRSVEGGRLTMRRAATGWNYLHSILVEAPMPIDWQTRAARLTSEVH